MTRTINQKTFLLMAISWMTCLHLPDMLAEAQLPELCNLPSETGPCRAAFQRFYFNSATQRCERFIYGGCRGNANNFRTEAQCQSACTCQLPVASGVWMSAGQWCRWQTSKYYDSSSQSCKSFFYWGCGGNGNRFRSNRQCRTACSASRCYVPRERRTCRSRSNSQRYFYNYVTGKCELFFYGGCNDRNENQFKSERACQRQCIP